MKIFSECFHECHLYPYHHEPNKIKEKISSPEASPEELWQAYDPKR